MNIPFTRFIFVMDGFPIGRVGINRHSQNQVKKGLNSCEGHFKLFPIICQLVFQTSIHKQPSQYMQYNKIVCFRKSTFQKKIKGIPSRTHFYSMSNILCNSLSHLKPTWSNNALRWHSLPWERTFALPFTFIYFYTAQHTETIFYSLTKRLYED